MRTRVWGLEFRRRAILEIGGLASKISGLRCGVWGLGFMASRDVEGIGSQELMGTIQRVVKGVDPLLKFRV